jgi:hypothetical protein
LVTEPIPYAGSDWDPRFPAGSGEPADEARRRGLRRLSKLTWRAAQLGAIAAVGFGAVFAHTAHAQTVSSPAPAEPAAQAATPAPGPDHGKAHRKRHHDGEAEPVTAGDQNPPAATPAAPTLAPPATPPSPAPATPSPAGPVPAPAHTTSSGSV